MTAESLSLEESSVQVSEIVGLLNLAAPNTLSDLRHSYPEFSETLKLGSRLGKTDNNKKRIHFLITVALEGVETARSVAERCATCAHRRLTTALRLEFASKAASLVGSLGTIILVLSVGKDAKTVTVAVCSFLASLAVAAAGLYRSGVGGGKHDLPTIHAKLSTSIADLDFLKARLGSYGQDDLADDSSQKDVARLVDRAENLCKSIRQWSSAVPGNCMGK